MLRIITIFWIALIAAVPTAWADAWKDCIQDTDPDLSIKGCTAIIKRGGETKQDLATAYTKRGLAYDDKEEYDQAIADYTKALEVDPKRPTTYYNRGVAYDSKKEYDRAISDYAKAIELNPKYKEAYNNRGSVYDAKGEHDRGIADFDKAIALEPEFINAYYNRGVVYHGKGDYDRAIADHTKVIELDPTFEDTYYLRGLERFESGDFKGASSDFLDALKQDENRYAILYLYLSRSRAGEPTEAELEKNIGRLETKDWPYPLAEFYLGKRTADSMLDAATETTLRCEAQFFLGEWHLLKGHKTDGEVALKTAVATCVRDSHAYEGAVAELKRLNP